MTNKDINISIKEYADIMGVTRQAVHWQINNNKLVEGVKPVKIGGFSILNVSEDSDFVRIMEEYNEKKANGTLPKPRKNKRKKKKAKKTVKASRVKNAFLWILAPIITNK